LYDLTVEVLPAPGTVIVQLLEEQAFPTWVACPSRLIKGASLTVRRRTIYAGSSVFLLAHIRIDSENIRRRGRNGHARQKSDELIEDLELQLGSFVVGYMQVRVSYSHSAFPEYKTMQPGAVGVSSLRSRLETTATATLKRRKNLSLWSARPRSCGGSLLDMIRLH